MALNAFDDFAHATTLLADNELLVRDLLDLVVRHRHRFVGTFPHLRLHKAYTEALLRALVLRDDMFGVARIAHEFLGEISLMRLSAESGNTAWRAIPIAFSSGKAFLAVLQGLAASLEVELRFFESEKERCYSTAEALVLLALVFRRLAGDAGFTLIYAITSELFRLGLVLSALVVWSIVEVDDPVLGIPAPTQSFPPSAHVVVRTYLDHVMSVLGAMAASVRNEEESLEGQVCQITGPESRAMAPVVRDASGRVVFVGIPVHDIGGTWRSSYGVDDIQLADRRRSRRRQRVATLLEAGFNPSVMSLCFSYAFCMAAKTDRPEALPVLDSSVAILRYLIRNGLARIASGGRELETVVGGYAVYADRKERAWIVGPDGDLMYALFDFERTVVGGRAVGSKVVGGKILDGEITLVPAFVEPTHLARIDGIWSAVASVPSEVDAPRPERGEAVALSIVYDPPVANTDVRKKMEWMARQMTDRLLGTAGIQA